MFYLLTYCIYKCILIQASTSSNSSNNNNNNTTTTSADSSSAASNKGLNRNVLVNAAVAHIHTLVDPYGPLPPPPFASNLC